MFFCVDLNIAISFRVPRHTKSDSNFNATPNNMQYESHAFSTASPSISTRIICLTPWPCTTIFHPNDSTLLLCMVKIGLVFGQRVFVRRRQKYTFILCAVPHENQVYFSIQHQNNWLTLYSLEILRFCCITQHPIRIMCKTPPCRNLKNNICLWIVGPNYSRTCTTIFLPSPISTRYSLLW